MTFGEAGYVEFGALKNKSPKIQGRGVGLAISPLLFLLLLYFGEKSFGARGGCVSFNQVHLLIFLGTPFVFLPRAFTNPIWTLHVE